MTISAGWLVLGALVVHLVLVVLVHRDARRQPGRAAGLDAGLALVLPVFGLFVYLRQRNAGERAAPKEARPSGASEDLLPRLTEELRRARAETAEWKARAHELERRLAERDPGP